MKPPTLSPPSADPVVRYVDGAHACTTSRAQHRYFGDASASECAWCGLSRGTVRQLRTGAPEYRAAVSVGNVARASARIPLSSWQRQRALCACGNTLNADETSACGPCKSVEAGEPGDAPPSFPDGRPPGFVEFEGRIYYATGKTGRDFETGEETAEYALSAPRVWCTASGIIRPD